MKETRKETMKALSWLIGLIALAIIGQIVTGCSPRMYPPAEIEHSVDTVIRERLVHDTVTFEIPLEKEVIVTRDTMSHLENAYAKSDARVEDGYLHHSLETIPQKVYVPVTVEVHDTTVVTKDAETIIKEVEKELSGFQKGMMTLGWILVGLLVLMALTFVVRNTTVLGKLIK